MQAQQAVTVRDVRGADELRACQAVQRRAWGITEDGYVIPVATMAGAQRVGGLVLGAFDADDSLVAFSFSFLGRLRGELVLYSQLTGVDPDHQSTGIGRLLKHEQRKRAREMGLQSVVWAFDPLQASNAAFNLHVLGATSRMYEVNMYGSRTDALNAGLATDRLVAEWPTAADEHREDDTWRDAPDVIETMQRGSLRAPVRMREAAATRVKVEIPADLTAVKRVPEIAQAWQQVVRQAFRDVFSAGYVAVGFCRADPQRPRYLVERRI
ncbi:MAG: GNAT family N-acetyltransferase [Chloroflexi bacterium]|nr:GNAT family N-acetyltransferase [Chloroflexota bacterium]